MARSGKMRGVGGKIKSDTASGSRGIPPGIKSMNRSSTTKGIESNTPTGVSWMGRKGGPSASHRQAPLD